jgi:hypothetical protein
MYLGLGRKARPVNFGLVEKIESSGTAGEATLIFMTIKVAARSKGIAFIFRSVLMA